MVFSGHSHSEDGPEHRGPRRPVPEKVIEALQRSGKKRGEHNPHPGQARRVHHPEGSHPSQGKRVGGHHPEGSHPSQGKRVGGHHPDRREGRPAPPKRVRQRIATL